MALPKEKSEDCVWQLGDQISYLLVLVCPILMVKMGKRGSQIQRMAWSPEAQTSHI